MFQRTVEIGHTYAPDRLVPLATDRQNGEMRFYDTAQAVHLRLVAKSLGKQSLRVAFVDDVVAREKLRSSSDSWRWALFIGVTAESVRTGSGAELVAFESAYESRARQMLETLKSVTLPSGYRISESGKNLIWGTGKEKESIPLEGFKGIDDPTHPSCQLMDLAWLEHRLQLAPEAVTVLPVGYETQQHQVSLLAGAFPHMQDAPTQSIFV